MTMRRMERRIGWERRAGLVALGLLVTHPLAAAGTPEFQVIVNPQSAVDHLDRSFLSRVFLKRVSHWPDGTPIRPADQRADAPVRGRFDEDILGRPVIAVRNGWQQAIFAGRDVPPPELDSDAAVVEYVLKYPGAIGYVSRDANVKGARIVEVR